MKPLWWNVRLSFVQSLFSSTKSKICPFLSKKLETICWKKTNSDVQSHHHFHNEFFNQELSKVHDQYAWTLIKFAETKIKTLTSHSWRTFELFRHTWSFSKKMKGHGGDGPLIMFAPVSTSPGRNAVPTEAPGCQMNPVCADSAGLRFQYVVQNSEPCQS